MRINLASIEADKESQRIEQRLSQVIEQSASLKQQVDALVAQRGNIEVG